MKMFNRFLVLTVMTGLIVLIGCENSDEKSSSDGVNGIYQLSSLSNRAIVEQESENGYYFKIEDNGNITVYKKGGKTLFKTGSAVASKNGDNLQIDFSNLRNFFASDIADEMDLEDAQDAFQEYDKLKAIIAAKPNSKDSMIALLSASQIELATFDQIAAKCDEYMIKRSQVISRAAAGEKTTIEKIREFLGTPEADNMDFSDLLEAFEAIDQFNQLMSGLSGVIGVNSLSDSRAYINLGEGLDNLQKVVDSRIQWELWELETSIKLELLEYYIAYQIIQAITGNAVEPESRSIFTSNNSELFDAIAELKSEMAELSEINEFFEELNDENIFNINNGTLTGKKYQLNKVADTVDTLF